MAEGSVVFTVNGVSHTVNSPAPWLTLNEWLRSQPNLKGTKRMCAEGGCGACVVMVSERKGDDVTHRAVNSCLYPVCGLNEATVTTVEGLGGSNLGKLHPIQQSVVDHNASQCGFCTPGMVMSMYSLLASSGDKVAPEAVEHAFDGNICRCTGYRPILDAMKSLCAAENPVDIEDLKGKCKGNCAGCPRVASVSQHIVSQPNGADSPPVHWYKPTSVAELQQLLKQYADTPHKIVAGDTGKGVYKNWEQVTVYIDVKAIPGASDLKLEQGQVSLGSCVTLSSLIQFLEKNLSELSYFGQLLNLVKHVANTPVRNSATWAGNFMMAFRDDFPSDVLTAFAALDPTISFLDTSGAVTEGFIGDFLERDVTNLVILSMRVPAPKPNSIYAVHKVMKRHENSHAYVNGSFNAVVDQETGVVSGQPFIFYGGLQARLFRAYDVEKYLVGKSVFESAVLEGAINVLKGKLPSVPMATSGSVEYRSRVAENLLYKFFIQAAGSHAAASNISALSPIRSGASSGSQSYDSDKSEYPMTESVPKLEIRAQATGEAQYVSDIPTIEGQLYGSFVMATQAPATLESIDSSKAESMPGVVKFISAASIPGKNSFSSTAEEVFVKSDVQYVGQAIGLVIADSEYHAEQAAKAVSCHYTSTGKPIITIHEAIAADSFFPDSAKGLVVGDIKAALADSAHRVSGQVSCGSQYSLHMETQSALCVPLEDGMDVYSSTQTIQAVQAAIANTLAIPHGSINVYVKRLGGGFGAKITRAAQIAAATALAAKDCNRPVLVHMSVDSNLLMVGKRYPWMADYEVGFDDTGLIKGVQCTMYADAGYNSADISIGEGVSWFNNTYNIPAWNITPKVVRTHTASNTYCRAPGSVPAIFFMENIIEHVAWQLGKTPDEVRVMNFYKKGEVDVAGQPLTYWNVDQLWSDIEVSADIAIRTSAIAEFNKANHWKKRGISRVPTKFGLDYFGAPFSVHVAVFGLDGTVVISHAGIEMGQGINTKVAQVAASILGIPVSAIHVKSAMSLTSANASGSGGSISSELCCKATVSACTELKERIEASTKTMPAGSTWQDRAMYCSRQGIDLTSRGWYKAVHTNTNRYAYNCYGVMVTEVEMDVLTGETNIVRADVLYDCGRSVNPELDIGQVEGATVMGFGYWLSEEMIYDSTSGANLTHNTWEYKPPMCLDIPQDMRVSFLKDSPNPLFALKSKAVGEPPQVMTCSALFAARQCVRAALQDKESTVPFIPLSGPATPDVLQPLCQPVVSARSI